MEECLVLLAYSVAKIRPALCVAVGCRAGLSIQ